MRTVKVFFAYQFSGAKLGKIEREAKYSAALDEVNHELKDEGRAIHVLWEYWNIESGVPVSKEIFDRMDSADLYVFDLSDDNRNVFIELGYALAACREKQKEIVIALHDDRPISGVPTDIRGLVVLRVNDINVQQKLTSEIYSKVKRSLSGDRIVKEFLSDGIQHGLHLVCPEIPKELRSRYADQIDPNYLRYLKFADLDTLFFLKTRLSCYCPKMEMTEFTGEEYFIDNDATQIVIGGPAWNRIAKLAQKNLPLKFEDGGEGNDDFLSEQMETRVESYAPEIVNGQLCADISFVARISRGPGRKTFVVSGCRTFGVLGAAKSLFEPTVAVPNLEWIDRNTHGADFLLAFKSAVVSGSVVAEQYIDADVIAMYVKADRKFIKSEPK